jgi:protein-disulfide isomerase
VTLVEYGNYECPYCGRAHPLVKEALEKARGQIRFVFRLFPLDPVHPNARPAAEAAEAAEATGAQDRFWEMHDVLYSNQDRLSARRR